MLEVFASLLSGGFNTTTSQFNETRFARALKLLAVSSKSIVDARCLASPLPTPTVNQTHSFDLNRGDVPVQPVLSGKTLVCPASSGEMRVTDGGYVNT